MFEVAVALSYLKPRRCHLSASIISTIAVIVIALVVWLVVVFFSVTHGLQESWLKKLVTVTAPAKLVPTDDYYRSYYYLIDSVSSRSDYTTKSIGEKLEAEEADPYDPLIDGELPAAWPEPQRDDTGAVKDLVKEAFAAVAAIQEVEGLRAYDFEIGRAELHLDLQREGDVLHLTQEIFLGSSENNSLAVAELPLEGGDGDGVVLPKIFREGGCRVGDRGWLAYPAATASAVHEQRLPVYVAGFYDPGIIPLGGKYILGGRHLASYARSGQHHDEVADSNGIYISFSKLGQADTLAKKLERELERRGLTPYWHLETFENYPFARELVTQLKSEKNLFTLLAAIVLAVACSNIASMLIILVHDKREEIGTLRAMGATAASIAAIFGLCGAIMGFVGSLLGILLAVVTLRHLHSLVDMISALQGQQLFNPYFYGDRLPTDLSLEAILFVVAVTGVLSLCAGLLPALRTAVVEPAHLLRAE